MAMQGRVASGASGQQKVANYFKSKHNATIISVATPGSNTTDIVLKIKNKKYHVEVKGAESLLNEVYVFDVSSSRSNTDFDFLNEAGGINTIPGPPVLCPPDPFVIASSIAIALTTCQGEGARSLFWVRRGSRGCRIVPIQL